MGNGQCGFARAAEYYFGRQLATFTIDDADKAALLAGIAKSPRDYAPSAKDESLVLRRGNETLMLMRENGFLSPEATARASRAHSTSCAATRPHRLRRPSWSMCSRSSPSATPASVSKISCRDESRSTRQRTRATADRQRRVGARPRPLRKRHPRARGLIQGSVVVLHNRDGRISPRRVDDGSSTAARPPTATTTGLRKSLRQRPDLR